jgi:hypothetical protein
MFVVFGFLTLLQNDIMTGFLAYFGADSADIQSMVLLDFEWEPVDVLRASVTSLGGLLMVVWLIPILIKRDFMELVAVAMALASPWLGEMLLEQTEVPQQQVAQMLDIVPLPVLALTAAMMVDRLFGGIKSVVTTTYRCPVCGNRTSPTIRFCPQCGTPVSDDMSEDSAPSST